MSRDGWRLIIWEMALVIMSVVIGSVLLAAVHFIPRGRMTGHVQESAAILHDENLHPQLWQGIDETNLDNTTDSLMINTAYTRSGDAVQDIFLNTHMKIEDVHVLESLYEVMCNGNMDYEYKTYGRYWHGYQIFLTPLLLVMNIAEIRQLNAFLQLMLVALLIGLSVRKNQGNLAIPFLTAYCFLCPVSLFSSLQFSTSLYVMLLAVIALLIIENCRVGGGKMQICPASDFYDERYSDGIF